MNKIILALDTTDVHQALKTTKKIIDKIFTVKLGLEFFNANGKSGIQKFNNIGVNNLMLDLKLKDIPQTKEAIKRYGSVDSGRSLPFAELPKTLKKKNKTKEK